MKRHIHVCSVILFLALLGLTASQPASHRISSARSQPTLSAHGQLPMSFELNQGQSDPRVKFLGRGRGYSLFLTSDEAVFALDPSLKSTRALQSSAAALPRKNPASPYLGLTAMHLPAFPNFASSGGTYFNKGTALSKPTSPDVLRLKLLGANSAARVVGLQELPGKTNYFIGNDPSKWRTNVPTFARVRYAEIYPGVDLIYHSNSGQAGQLEYDFVVQPGADPRQIAMQIPDSVPDQQDASSHPPLRIDRNGALILGTANGEVRWQKPAFYQVNDDATKTYVDGSYALAESKISFEVAAYDRSKPLVIDPTLVYSTYLGPGNADAGNSIAADVFGNVYLTGHTFSSEFPTTSGAFQPTPAQTFCDVAFVTKLNATGSALLYSTYLGGTGADGFDESNICTNDGTGIAVDAEGNAYVTGSTDNFGFPTTAGAFQTEAKAIGGGGTLAYFEHVYAFITKLNAAGSGLIYSTYLGGTHDAVDANTDELYTSIAVDVAGNAYVTGRTYSSDFPSTPGAFQAGYHASKPEEGYEGDAFVTKLNPAGSALIYSTFLGGTGWDVASGISADKEGNVYVTGHTNSPDFPTTTGAFQTTYKGSTSGDFMFGDAFVTKINPTGSGLVYSTLLGGTGADVGNGIAIDAEGNAFVTGNTYSPDFPTTSGAFQTAYHGDVGESLESYGGDAFVTKLNPSGSVLVYSTFLGGTAADSGNGIAIDGEGSAYITGTTFSADFPVTPGAFQTICRDCANWFFTAFVSKLSASGSKLAYSTFLGGSGFEDGRAITVSADGSAYVTGETASSDFPVTPGAFQTSCEACSTNSSDIVRTAFVTKFDFGIGPPSDKEQCKNGGWETFTIPRKFKNQGQCVSYVETGK